MLDATQIKSTLGIRDFNHQGFQTALLFIQKIIKASESQQKILGRDLANFAGLFNSNFQASQSSKSIKVPTHLLKDKSAVGIAILLDSILQPFNHAKTQIRTFCNSIQESIKKFFVENFHKLKDFKAVHQLTQELHKLNDDTEIYSLLTKLRQAGKKTLIFDIDGTLRELELGSEGHMIPNIDPEVIASLIKINQSKEFDIYFVTTRSPGEIKASNIPYQQIPTFCSNGEFLLFGKDDIQEARHDVNPNLTKKTKEMENAVRKYIEVNYPKMEINFITNRGAVCFGIKGGDYTENIRSITNDLELITSGSNEWEVKTFGRFVSINHKEFAADKYAPLIDIFLTPARNGDSLTGSDIYIFGDSEAELQASTKLKEAGKGSNINLVMIRKKKDSSDKRVDFELSSPRTLGNLIKELTKQPKKTRL